MSECIICHEKDNLITYDHCGAMFVHNSCLFKWYELHGYKCFICNKFDENAYDFFYIFNPSYLEKYSFLVVILILSFYSLIFFIL